MFALVKFTDNSEGIYPIKAITKEGNVSLVKHKGSRYEATVLKTSDDKNDLIKPKVYQQLIAVPLEQHTDTLATVPALSENSLNVIEDFVIESTPGEIDNTVGTFSTDFGAFSLDYNTSNSLLDLSNFGENVQEHDNQPRASPSTPIDYQDDSVDDPNYDPSPDDHSHKSSECGSDSSNLENPINNTMPNSANNTNITLNTSDTYHELGTAVVDDAKMFVAKSRGRKGDKKSNFCFYCHKKQQKISRHLEVVHKNEEDVKKFSSLPRGHPERKKIIGMIRKKGNFIFNTNENFNDGELIVSRRPKKAEMKSGLDFKACANCKAFLSKNSLRTHFNQCTGRNPTTRGMILQLSKKVSGRVHVKASETVRKYLFPILREDHIILLIRYDELVITFANKMCQKYRNHRFHEMIRQRMRLLGRFLCTIKKINKEVTDLSSIYDPKFCDDTLKAINLEARFNETKSIFEAPTVAFSLGTLLKQVGNIHITECIKNHLSEKRKHTEDFLKLLVQEINISINRTVAESQLAIKRKQKVELPSKDDIKKLHSYLLKSRIEAFDQLNQQFSNHCWKTLAESTLLGIQLFNRRRPGEVERTTIEDFSNYQAIDQDTNKDLFESLSNESRQIANKYVRFTIRGKLNRTVPVLLDNNLLKCMKLLIQCRAKTGVLSDNPYVFGIPTTNKNGFNYLRACNIMRKYSEQCGAQYPERLRGTNLRKHIATTCITLNLEGQEISDLADFMGHAENIHKKHYRQPIISREILRMSKILEAVQGDDTDSSEDEQIIPINLNEIPSSSYATNTPVNFQNIRKRPKRSTSPYGSVKRVRWTEEEMNVIYSNFSEHLKRRTLPSLSNIQQIVKENPVLQNRTSPQIKTWISNQYKKK